jgi:hypothetical protein
MRAPPERHAASSGRTPAQVKGSGYPGIFVAQSLLRRALLYTKWKYAQTGREPEEFFDRR